MQRTVLETSTHFRLHEFMLRFNRQDNSISLVKACWNELFTLGLAQCSQIMNVATILTAFVNHLHSSLQQGKERYSSTSLKRGIGELNGLYNIVGLNPIYCKQNCTYGAGLWCLLLLTASTQALPKTALGSGILRSGL